MKTILILCHRNIIIIVVYQVSSIRCREIILQMMYTYVCIYVHMYDVYYIINEYQYRIVLSLTTSGKLHMHVQRRWYSIGGVYRRHDPAVKTIGFSSQSTTFDLRPDRGESGMHSSHRKKKEEREQRERIATGVPIFFCQPPGNEEDAAKNVLGGVYSSIHIIRMYE